jgi:hypothetical protein
VALRAPGRKGQHRVEAVQPVRLQPRPTPDALHRRFAHSQCGRQLPTRPMRAAAVRLLRGLAENAGLHQRGGGSGFTAFMLGGPGRPNRTPESAAASEQSLGAMCTTRPRSDCSSCPPPTRESAGREKRLRPAKSAQAASLPRIAASRNRWWQFSAVAASASKGGRRIDNPPQIANLPHNSSRHAKNMTDSSTCKEHAHTVADLVTGPRTDAMFPG